MSVYKIRYGTPEKTVPSKYAPKPKCEIIEEIPKGAENITYTISQRGIELYIPANSDDGIYGFGLQMKRVQHRGRKKMIRPNSDPTSDTGDSHAPVPFFVTTSGYGIYVDTARYASFYCGREMKSSAQLSNSGVNKSSRDKTDMSLLSDLYEAKGRGQNYITVEIPYAKGVDIYYITGENILSVVSQYNMLSGGGCMPTLWGLGCFYRCDMRFNSDEILNIAKELRESDIPCDILGFEPSWQSQTYSSSFVWHPENFKNPKETIEKLKSDNYHVNLWQQAFIHPTSPLYEKLIDKSGDYLVWQGLVPDFCDNECRNIFSDYIKEELVNLGIDGFKLDECDGGDYTGGWTFPNCTLFPSGADGEQYHSLFGTLYAQAVTKALGNIRSLGQIRNLGAFSASYPYVLYSDLYNHKDFITALVNSGFSGLLWAPEVRHATDKDDMLRRIQSVVFSAQPMINACYLKELPWKKHNCTDEVRELFKIRMSLIPYLFESFYQYHTTGKPPIRALVCDYENEIEAWDITDEYLFGDSIIVAPIISGTEERDVWLPKGEWYNFFTNEKFNGGVHHTNTDKIPVYVKSGTILPIAKPLNFIKSTDSFDITLNIYGEVGDDTECRLVEDSDDTYDANYTIRRITKNSLGRISDRYNLTDTRIIK